MADARAVPDTAALKFLLAETGRPSVLSVKMEVAFNAKFPAAVKKIDPTVRGLGLMFFYSVCD